jgi:hypothetical protein
MYITIEEQAGVSFPRGDPRMKVLLSGELRSRLGTFMCRVHDLSRGGACVEADMPHATGERVTFIRAGLEVKGTVGWSNGRRFGVIFDERIRATELLVQMSHSRQSAAVQTAAVQAAAARPSRVTGAATPLFPSR